MEFTGRVFFDFVSRNTWHFYKMVAAGAQAGATIHIDWQPVADSETSEGELAAMRSLLWAKRERTDRHGLFLQALLILIHEEQLDIDAASTLRQAAEAAGLDARDAEAGAASDTSQADLDAASAEAGQLGVRQLPSLYRHGPVVHIKANGAAVRGDVVQRLETIKRMLDDDGLWELAKP